MSENRDEILANFQSITAVDDVAEAIFILEECNWDLLAAVNRVMPLDDSFNNRGANMDVVENVTPPQPPLPALNNIDVLPQWIQNNIGVGSSKPRENKRLLQFHVRFKATTIDLTLSSMSTIGQLKSQLATRSGVPTCHQILLNWPEGATPHNDAILSTLNLREETTLTLADMRDQNAPMDDDDSTIAERLAQTYTLNILNEDTDMSYSLKFPGTRSVLEVKTDVYTLTDIPVRHQVWTGWPIISNLDNTMLAIVGLDQPSHNLTVKKLPQADINNSAGCSNRRKDNIHVTAINKWNFCFYFGHNFLRKLRKYAIIYENYLRQPFVLESLIKCLDDWPVIVDLMDSDSEVEEFEDASESFNVEDDIFIDQVQTRKIEPLIPDNVDDETIGCLHFTEQFQLRYGSMHPCFFTGSLEDAVKEATQKPVRDRKMLAIYLHHDASVLSNVFCTQLLGFESVLQTLAQNFVVYGWDLTYESNRNMFLSSLSGCLGSSAALTVRSIPTERLPAIILVMRTRSVTEVFSVINGNVGVNELLTSLMEALDVFLDSKRQELREEEDRAAREQVKWEQDMAYRESLEADRAKDESRQQQQIMAKQERQRLESEKQEQDTKKEALRQQVEESLPAEPDGSGDGITVIRARLPRGEFVERRFTTSTRLKVLLDFLTAKGYPRDEYKVISSWPRRDLTTIDPDETLHSLQLFPQETVIVEER